MLLREKNRGAEISDPDAKKCGLAVTTGCSACEATVTKPRESMIRIVDEVNDVFVENDAADVALDDPGGPVLGVGDDVDVTGESKSREHSGLRCHGRYDGDVIDSDVENRVHIPTSGEKGSPSLHARKLPCRSRTSIE